MIRCHQISQIMTGSKSKTDNYGATAVNAMREMARTQLFGVTKSLDQVMCLRKGIALEDDAIAMYNRVFLTDFKKYPDSGRKNNGIITGAPDIVAEYGDKGVDTKIAWSLLTFPMFPDQAAKDAYEWQARGYMSLYDKNYWEIAYCAMDTPDEMLKPYDDIDAHKIDPAIPEHHRITIATFERDELIEAEMLARCHDANLEVDKYIKQFASIHDAYIA